MLTDTTYHLRQPQCHQYRFTIFYVQVIVVDTDHEMTTLETLDGGTGRPEYMLELIDVGRASFLKRHTTTVSGFSLNIASM